jgi:hypothetical protein
METLDKSLERRENRRNQWGFYERDRLISLLIIRRISKGETVLAEIHEIVLIYRQEQFDAWVAGDRSLIPAFVDPAALVRNLPRRHFGEMFVLRHYNESAGWRGFSSYALGLHLPGSERRKLGRAMAETVIPGPCLRRFRSLRTTAGDKRFGGGEPDLFLYDSAGRYKFVEVKMGADRMRPAQLRCIAQILRTLRCDVDVVYLRESGQQYWPKTYVFDLRRCAGWRKSSNLGMQPTAFGCG